MRRHPEYGEKIARESGVSDPKILSVIRSHHERWDGCGYPDGVVGATAPLEARIAAVADVFDALTTKRIYKDAMESRAAVSLIVESTGTHFDGVVVRSLLRQLLSSLLQRQQWMRYSHCLAVCSRQWAR